ANPNALENDRYDIVAIAAVANDVPTLKVALELGGSARTITSRYDGTALIAAAHLGHAEVVRTLIAAGAPLDHVNNLGWTATIESIVLGDGGPRHVDTLKALIDAGADLNLADRQRQTPLALAQARRYTAMVEMLRQAKARCPAGDAKPRLHPARADGRGRDRRDPGPARDPHLPGQVHPRRDRRGAAARRHRQAADRLV